ncbi:hypothetical protein PENNAL_c0260G01595 [Penicillium nalgiovense]|uniref:Uncharacterized protein n=1 Tax=Penicillium nalgiovense TaxID=60175 RepID=A0A1V6WJ32_PENNA|nr:hypothetical protein PENNAL_c0260G01595 [Penicillium nalgiovense]
MPLISRQPKHRAGDELDTMPLLVRRPKTRPSRKPKGANSPARSKLQQDQPTLRLRLQQRCMTPEAWWTSLTATFEIGFHILHRETLPNPNAKPMVKQPR